MQIQLLTAGCLLFLILPNTLASWVADITLSSGDLTCARSSSQSCGPNFPGNFCCNEDSDCISIDRGQSALCCPKGRNCNKVDIIPCGLQLQNATRYPSSMLFSMDLKTPLPTCGDQCCPRGMQCEEDPNEDSPKCVQADTLPNKLSSSTTAAISGTSFTQLRPVTAGSFGLSEGLANSFGTGLFRPTRTVTSSSLITTISSRYTTSLPSVVILASGYTTGTGTHVQPPVASVSGQSPVVTGVSASIGSMENNINAATGTSLYWTLPKGSLTIAPKSTASPSTSGLRTAAGSLSSSITSQASTGSQASATNKAFGSLQASSPSIAPFAGSANQVRCSYLVLINKIALLIVLLAMFD